PPDLYDLLFEGVASNLARYNAGHQTILSSECIEATAGMPKQVCVRAPAPRMSGQSELKLLQAKDSNMSVQTLEELVIDELKELYSAEKQIVRALPKLARAATTPDLNQALLSHLEETKGQVERLEKVAEIIERKLTGKTCSGMQGVLEEGSEVLEDTEKGIVRDAALIAASQRVEHYEMAGYGAARDFAKLLGLSDVASLLEETLEEEKNADKKLSSIATGVNKQAKQAA
ncbi:MAG: ferritin-like domain-containing protein, partial [Terracidiphilus sp.]